MPITVDIEVTRTKRQLSVGELRGGRRRNSGYR
jgi:hypothetical protein